VAREAARTLQYYRVGVHEIYDVGVAGLWRLLERVEELRDMGIVITVAGMEGTLPSVVAGLVPGLVIAVPVATGYGVAANGITALNSALASCAPGLVVVNVDNGYGAGCAALRMLNVMQRSSGHGDGSG
jgi:NCAIR mutase (PurE)-related protein